MDDDEINFEDPESEADDSSDIEIDSKEPQKAEILSVITIKPPNSIHNAEKGKNLMVEVVEVPYTIGETLKKIDSEDEKVIVEKEIRSNGLIPQVSNGTKIKAENAMKALGLSLEAGANMRKHACRKFLYQ